MAYATGGRTDVALVPQIAASILEAARIDDGQLSEALCSYYCERMPRERLAQLDARPLFDQRLDGQKLPRLRAALDGIFAACATHGVDAARLLAAPSADALLSARPSVAALYDGTLFSPGVPLVSAGEVNYARLTALAAARGLEAAVDHLLTAALVHELCHGRARPAHQPLTPWLLLEAAALHLGCTAAPTTVFPDEPGQALPGVAPFVLVGDMFAACFGTAALWNLLLDQPLDGVHARVASALRTAEWQLWLRRRDAPFAYGDDPWGAIKLIDWARSGALPVDATVAASPKQERPLLALAAQVPWSELPSWREPVRAGDGARLARGVQSLFFVHRVDGIYQTAPSEPPAGRLTLDVAACQLSAERRTDGVVGEPARWLVPPPYARRLHDRGARTVTIEGATRARVGELTARLLEFVDESAPLPAQSVLRW